MTNSPSVEMVVASFDDPIVTGLRVEQEAERAARPGSAAGLPADDTGAVFLVARHAYVLIGCAGLQWIADDAAEIKHVYVRPEYREPGIARLLLAGVEDLARRRGFAVARLGVDDHETELYEASGYARVAGVCFEKSLRMGAPRQGAG